MKLRLAIGALTTTTTAYLLLVSSTLEETNNNNNNLFNSVEAFSPSYSYSTLQKKQQQLHTSSSSAFIPRKLQQSPFSSSRQGPTTSPTSSSITSRPLVCLNMSYTIGIVGATGAVGKEIRTVLEKRQKIPITQLRIFGSERSAGTQIASTVYGPTITVELFTVDSAKQCDVCFLAVSGEFALQYAKELTNGSDGCIVIDNSSAFRYEKDVPLVVPEINGCETKNGKKLIANPNCTTAIGLMALWPLHKAFVLKKIIMSTYQAASGAGQEGMDELKNGTMEWLQSNGENVGTNKVFAHPLPFNVIPHIDKFQENGYTKEEMKVAWESRKICNLPDDFPISCTAVRIPTIRAHSESIVIETEKPVDIDIARKVLSEQSGLTLVDNTSTNEYPMPSSCTGQDNVEVGRVRKSLVFGDYGLEVFVCGDQLLRGAALNAVLIAEEMITNGSLHPKQAMAPQSPVIA